MQTGNLFHTFKTGIARDVRALSFSPDGRWIATVQGRGLSSRGGWIDVWTVLTGEKSSLHPSRPQSVCFSPDGKWLVSADHDDVTIWSLESDEPVLELKGHSNVESVAFSPGGRRIVSGSKDMTALIWQPLLTEADSAKQWAQATQSLPAIEGEKRFNQLVETLITKDYRHLCRTRERILASGPACLDLLIEAFPPATVIEEDRLNALLQRLTAGFFRSNL